MQLIEHFRPMALKLDTLINSGFGGLRWEGAALALSNDSFGGWGHIGSCT